jgi:methylase of polypeptide subunit release factors
VLAKSHLKSNGKIYVEVNEAYAKNVKYIFENAGFISEIKKDIYGKERMVSAAFI